MSTLITKAEKLKSDFEAAKTSLKLDVESVEFFRVSWLGKKGHVSKLFEELRSCSKEERPEAGKNLNVLRQNIETSIENLKQQAEDSAIEELVNSAEIDITLPVSQEFKSGSLHPVTLMRQKILREFRRHGFTVYDGPELDFDFYNFSALNIPQNHPARDMQDTFHIKGDKGMVLRTQTSNIQIHAMLNEQPPIRVVAPGRVFRVDSDPTHTPIFHQVECIVVEEGISFAHLKGMIETLLRAIYGTEVKTRFRPSFFPFVEPGAEVDVECSACKGKGCKLCKNTGWIEIGGCGLVHPNVFECVNYDVEKYTGFAFGFGIDRMAMTAYNLPDLRQLFDGDSEFQKQFPALTH